MTLTSGKTIGPYEIPVNGGKIEGLQSRGVAQPGSAPALGAGGRWFESSRPDQFDQESRTLGG